MYLKLCEIKFDKLKFDKFDKLKFDTLKIGHKAVRPSLLSTTWKIMTSVTIRFPHESAKCYAYANVLKIFNFLDIFPSHTSSTARNLIFVYMFLFHHLILYAFICLKMALLGLLLASK